MSGDLIQQLPCAVQDNLWYHIIVICGTAKMIHVEACLAIPESTNLVTVLRLVPPAHLLPFLPRASGMLDLCGGSSIQNMRTR
jgi:hypothetical protein